MICASPECSQQYPNCHPGIKPLTQAPQPLLPPTQTAIATHIAINDYSMDYVISEVRKSYDGPLAVARDLDYWEIGVEEIEAGRLMVADATWGLIFGDETPVLQGPVAKQQAGNVGESKVKES